MFANSQSLTGEQASEVFFLKKKFNGFFLGFYERKSMLIESGHPDLFWNWKMWSVYWSFGVTGLEVSERAMVDRNLTFCCCCCCCCCLNPR